MKTILRLFAVLMMLAGMSLATTVTLQVTDADSQAWINGTWEVQAVISSTPSHVSNGALSGTGGATITLTPLTAPGSFYRFVVCPFASSACYAKDAVIVGSTQTVTAVPPAIRIDGRQLSTNLQAYADAEITNPVVGKKYYNTVDLAEKQWNGSAWVAAGGGGGDLTGAVILAPTGDQTISGAHDLILSDPGAELHIVGDAYFNKGTFSGPDADASDASGNHLFDWADLNLVIPDERWAVNSFRTTFAPSADLTNNLFNSYFVTGIAAGNTHNSDNVLSSIYSETTHNGTGSLAEINGIETWSGNESSGHIEDQFGIHSWAENDGTGTVSTITGIYTYAGNYGGAVTNAVGIQVGDGGDSGPITNFVGLEVDIQNGTQLTNGIGIKFLGDAVVGAGSVSSVNIGRFSAAPAGSWFIYEDVSGGSDNGSQLTALKVLNIATVGDLIITNTHSTTGTRFLCVSTTGVVTASASACSGT